MLFFSTHSNLKLEVHLQTGEMNINLGHLIKTRKWGKMGFILSAKVEEDGYVV